MQINDIKIENHQTLANANTTEKSNKTIPAFKGAGFVGSALNGSGWLMQGIENQGFWLQFICQDLLGMTTPRVITGFNRDRDITGKYNIQEGFEVLGREGLTGPIMMAVAPIMFGVAALFGKSTTMNTRLIKRFGNKLTEIVKNSDFDKKLLTKPNEFKELFYKENLKELLNNSLGKDNVNDELINKILKHIENYENIPKDANIKGLFGKKKYKANCIASIEEEINKIKYNTSDKLQELNKLKFSADAENNKTFKIKDVIEGMVKYSDDSIKLNKNLINLNEISSVEIRNKSLAKRLIANISTLIATLGVLSVLPKIYARSKVAPGARLIQKDDKQNNKNCESHDINFKGKNPTKKSLLSKIGGWFNKIDKEKTSEFEYNGNNFTNTLMAGLSVFGLIAPRGIHAVNRAQKDENGKKDLTELYEILIRDVTSSLAVVFAVPMLTRACVLSYEKNSGFVLMDRNRKLSKKKQTLDLLNPYNKAHVFTNKEINNIYNSVDNKAKMINFCKFIDNNGGDLQKILVKSQNYSALFNENTLDLKSLDNLTKQEKNKRILDHIINRTDNNLDEKISQVMKNTCAKKNKILSLAKGLNSVPGMIATFIISPLILGVIIPKITYANTRRIHEKQEKEKNNTINKNA